LFTIQMIFRSMATLATAAALMLCFASEVEAEVVRNIVIVHGAFADGSGWETVSDLLRLDGYNVQVVQPPLTSLDEDVAATQRVIDAMPGPSILVGHSYGGVVTTEAGTDPNVVGLVYIAAFIPDTGESALTLATETPAAAIGDIEVTADGLFLLFNEANFPADFAGDVPVVHSQFMARSQVLLSLAAFEAPVTVPAWRSKPSWALVASNDRVINPDQELALAERAGSRIIAVPSSHVAYISHPIAVAGLIEAASTGSTP
jgi:pimeloyl-ACP methyl ester carboxylesterase